jgi:arylsulfatase
MVLIVIDTLRADHLGCYGYFRDTSPNIDAFAEQAIFFEQAYAPMATTMPSHTSLFTGLYPLEHGILANAIHGGKAFGSRPGIRSFVQLAKDNGYATGAFVSGAPLKSACGLSAGFDTYDEPREKLRTAQRTTDRTLAWLDRHSGERFLLFVHYFDPHFPYQPPPRYRAMFRTDPELERYLAEREVTRVIQPSLCRGTRKTVARRVTNLYDAEIRYCDEHVGRLLDSLRERGLWDKSAIILTSDHGEGLNQHAWPQHGRTWNEQVQVPLMIRFPGPRDDLPKRFAPLVSLIDVFPTVLGQLKPAWAETFLQQATGVDVLAPAFQPRAVLSQRSGRDCRDQGGPLYALTSERWRHHYFSEGEELLFDRLMDPHELQDVAPITRTQVGQMRRQVLELVAGLEQRAASFGPDTSGPLQLDPELQRQMEALGYVASASDEEADPNDGEQATTNPTDQPNSP